MEQIAYSASTYALLGAGTILLDLTQFGRLSLAFNTALMAMVIARGLFAEAAIVFLRGQDQGSDSRRQSLVEFGAIGVVAPIVLLLSGLLILFTGPASASRAIGMGLMAAAPGTIAEGLRGLSLAKGNTSASTAGSLLWLVASATVYAVCALADVASDASLLFGYGVGAAAMIAYLCKARPAGLIRVPVRFDLGADYGLERTGQLVALFALNGALGPVVFGGFETLRFLASPLNVLYQSAHQRALIHRLSFRKVFGGRGWVVLVLAPSSLLAVAAPLAIAHVQSSTSLVVQVNWYAVLGFSFSWTISLGLQLVMRAVHKSRTGYRGIILRRTLVLCCYLAAAVLLTFANGAAGGWAAIVASTLLVIGPLLVWIVGGRPIRAVAICM